jgi:hypothetical protein
MIDTYTADDKPFNQIEPFEFCGVEYARVDGRSLLIRERAYMASGRAKDLRDWLTRALAAPFATEAPVEANDYPVGEGPIEVTTVITSAEPTSDNSGKGES